MKKKFLPSILILIILAASACSSYAPEATPASNAGGTSNPAGSALAAYGVKVKVTNQDGQPITWANAVVNVSGNDLSKRTDSAGQAAWSDLTGASGTISIFAQGYKTAHQALNLGQGSNELVVVMDTDPFQVDPAKACLPGEKMVYVEDFEDGQAQDFEDLVKPKWKLVNLPERGIVLNVNSPGGNAKTMVNAEFGNAVWQFALKASGPINVDINWHYSEVTEGSSAGLSRDYIVFQPGNKFELNFSRPGESGVLAESEAPGLEPDSWHNFAIADYKGAISVWLDGKMAMSANHDNPIEKGKFGFQINPATQAEIWFDNLIVCGLSAPYSPVRGNP